jgi:hypothetical protein
MLPFTLKLNWIIYASEQRLKRRRCGLEVLGLTLLFQMSKVNHSFHTLVINKLSPASVES